MAKITAEKIKSVNNRCSNGWALNVIHFSSFGENALIKRITIDEQNFLEFSLGYNSSKQISLHISEFHHKPNENVAVSEGLGKIVILEETSAKRKSVDNLIAFTEKLTNEKLLELEKNTNKAEVKGIVKS